MKKKWYLLSFVIIILLYFYFSLTNFVQLKEISKTYINLYEIKNEISTNNEKIKKLTNENDNLKKIKDINKKIKKFLIERYTFKYDDYTTLNIKKIEKIKDINNNKFYILVELEFSSFKSTTLISVINLLYQDNFIKKINLNKKINTLYFYIDKDLLEKKLRSKGYL